MLVQLSIFSVFLWYHLFSSDIHTDDIFEPFLGFLDQSHGLYREVGCVWIICVSHSPYGTGVILWSKS